MLCTFPQALLLAPASVKTVHSSTRMVHVYAEPVLSSTMNWISKALRLTVGQIASLRSAVALCLCDFDAYVTHVQHGKILFILSIYRHLGVCFHKLFKPCMPVCVRVCFRQTNDVPQDRYVWLHPESVYHHLSTLVTSPVHHMEEVWMWRWACQSRHFIISPF